MAFERERRTTLLEVPQALHDRGRIYDRRADGSVLEITVSMTDPRGGIMHLNRRGTVLYGFLAGPCSPQGTSDGCLHFGPGATTDSPHSLKLRHLTKVRNRARFPVRPGHSGLRSGVSDTCDAGPERQVRCVPELMEGRVLMCGSRRWPWPSAVATVLDRLSRRHGDRLVVIEGAATGADAAACRWCRRHGLQADRHRCHPVDWAAVRRERPNDWRMAGPERNTRMLLHERPGLVIAFHDHFNSGGGGTSDMCLRALLDGVPVWLVSGNDVEAGTWLGLEIFPKGRVQRVQAELAAARAVHHR